MPIKLSDEVRTQFDTNLSTKKKYNAKDLIRRDELGSELNFADAETDFETAINLFKGLADIDIMRVPESIIRDLNNEMSTFINSIEQIKSFSSMQGPDVRQNLIDNITNNYNNSWFKTISPIVAYCTKAGTDYESLQRQAHEALENIKKEHMDIINQKNKKLEEQKKRGREYFKYLDELEILKREKVNTPKREEELIKKIEEREEAGKRYAEYKRNLKKWIKHMKKYLKNNEYIY